MRSVCTVFLVCLLCCVAIGQSPAQQGSKTSPKPSGPDSVHRLPIKRVVLYKNGIGYFEHSARVRGDQDLTIDFTSAQLNDVLKSLTAVDLGDGRISGIRYNSMAPLSERLKTLRLPFGEQVSRSEFLAALRGSRVEVRNGNSSAIGRLLSVEQETRTIEKDRTYSVTSISVLTDNGEMRNFEVTPATSVRVAERDLNDEVGRYLNLIGSSRAQDLRRMTLTATGAGDRDIFVSYISEVPIWKCTYRMILPEKADRKPLLQGWAIVDNTIGEDWKDVHLTLVAGAPQSFIQDISQPYYARRPVIAPPASVMLTPQTHEASLDEQPRRIGHVGGVFGGVPGGSVGGVIGGIVSNTPSPHRGASSAGRLEGRVTDPSGAVVPGATITARHLETGASQTTTSLADGSYRFNLLPAGKTAVEAFSPGFQKGRRQVYITLGATSKADVTLTLGSVAEMVSIEDEADQLSPDAIGKSAGDYFQYDIKQNITIGKNQSALVPILQSRIEAEKVTLWSPKEGEEEAPAVRALWVRNTSGQVLDGGTFNVIESNTFGGEGILESIQPNERRLLSYAADTAVHVRVATEATEKPYSQVKISEGQMILTRQEWRSAKFTVRNADTTPRQVVIEVGAEEGWELTKNTPKPEESSASLYRFRIPVEPGKTAQLVVEAVHPDETAYMLVGLEPEIVNILVKQKRVTPALQQVFDRVTAQRRKVDDINRQIGQRRQETNEISTAQARVRENMKALKGSAEEKTLLLRYTRQLESQEDRIDALNREIADLQQKHTQEQQELARIVQGINLEETF